MDTFAPAIAAPDGSVMVPDSVAPETCAYALPAEKIVMAKMANTENVAVILCEKILCGMDVLSRRSGPDDITKSVGCVAFNYGEYCRPHTNIRYS